MSLPIELKLDEIIGINLWYILKKEVKKYGLEVNITSLGVLENQLFQTGTFNGLKINISDKVDLSTRLFLLLHLFGHTVQCCSPSESELVNNFFNSSDMEYLEEYEFRAAQFSLWILKKCYKNEYKLLDGWFRKFVNADYLMVLRTHQQNNKLADLSKCVDVLDIWFDDAPIPEDFRPKLLGRVSVAF